MMLSLHHLKENNLAAAEQNAIDSLKAYQKKGYHYYELITKIITCIIGFEKKQPSKELEKEIREDLEKRYLTNEGSFLGIHVSWLNDIKNGASFLETHSTWLKK